VRRADNLTTFMCRFSWNLGASTFWNPQGLPRPIMGLLYLYLYTLHLVLKHISPVVQQPNYGLGPRVVGFVDQTQLDSHTHTHTHTPTHIPQWGPSEWMITLPRRPLPTQHTTNTIDEHPCTQLDSNPRFQQSDEPQTHALDRTAVRIDF